MCVSGVKWNNKAEKGEACGNCCSVFRRELLRGALIRRRSVRCQVREPARNCEERGSWACNVRLRQGDGVSERSQPVKAWNRPCFISFSEIQRDMRGNTRYKSCGGRPCLMVNVLAWEKKKLVRWGTGENTDCYSALGRWLEKSNLMSLSREEHVVPWTAQQVHLAS